MPSTNSAHIPDPGRGEMRSAIRIAGAVRIGKRAVLPATVINVSRHGVQLALIRTLKAGQMVSLDVEGWPPLISRVIWSQDGRAGCMFSAPATHKDFRHMLALANGVINLV